jgi:DNA-binding transcriptional MerR regulator
MGYSVGELARYASVSVRTLHHYDEIGLLSPNGRTTAGYRRYDEPDLVRLQQILFYRELGFALEEIATILDAPDTDALAHLRRQHELLDRRITRLRGMVAAVERAMEAQEMGISLTPQERFEVFGDHDPAQYADEVQERWGGTDAFQQSQQRTGSYTKEDWARITAEAADIERRLAQAMAAGEAPDSEAAMNLAEEHRQHINRWYYDCPPQMHRCVGAMYVDDERFRQRYEGIAPGLARYVRDAAEANADRAGAQS